MCITKFGPNCSLSALHAVCTTSRIFANQHILSCGILTRFDLRGEAINQRLVYFDCRFHNGQSGKVTEFELFTLRDPHPFWCAPHLPLVSSQAMVGCDFGPATVANLEAHV